MLPHALPYIFSKFSMVWIYFQRATTRYRQIYEKNIYEYIFKKITVTHGNALQIAQNQANVR